METQYKLIKGQRIYILNLKLYTRRISEIYSSYIQLCFLENCCVQDLCLTIEPDTFLEVLLLRIRGETIKYAALIKKLQSKLEKTLISEIEKLEAGENTLDPDILELKKQELVEFRKKELKGHMIRSRIQWLAEGEKPSRFFVH